MDCAWVSLFHFLLIMMLPQLVDIEIKRINRKQKPTEVGIKSLV